MAVQISFEAIFDAALLSCGIFDWQATRLLRMRMHDVLPIQYHLF